MNMSRALSLATLAAALVTTPAAPNYNNTSSFAVTVSDGGSVIDRIGR